MRDRGKAGIVRKKGGEKADRKNKASAKARKIVFVFKVELEVVPNRIFFRNLRAKNFMSILRSWAEGDTENSL